MIRFQRNIFHSVCFRWDYTCSIPELMQSLDHLVKSGKVLYLGASDTPAWVVAKANQYARDYGLRQFSVYQGLYSAAKRDVEREILPMIRDEGMAFAPWGALGGGKFKTKEQLEAMEKAGDKGRAFGGFRKGEEKTSISSTLKISFDQFRSIEGRRSSHCCIG